jgi:hypothetical protein
MKKYYLILFLVFNIHLCYPQDVDSIISFLEGQWEWYWTSKGGFAGGHITPEDAGYNITVEFKALNGDSINFYLFKDDTLICDIISPISPVDTIIFLALSKTIIPCLNKYLYKFTPIQDIDYLGLFITDTNHISFREPSWFPESPEHLFERTISNSIKPTDNEYKINIFPNPFIDKINITFGSSHHQKAEISLVNCSLNCIYLEKVILDSDNYTLNIEILDSFSPGIYFLRIVLKEKIFIRKVIKL